MKNEYVRLVENTIIEEGKISDIKDKIKNKIKNIFDTSEGDKKKQDKKQGFIDDFNLRFVWSKKRKVIAIAADIEKKSPHKKKIITTSKTADTDDYEYFMLEVAKKLSELAGDAYLEFLDKEDKIEDFYVKNKIAREYERQFEENLRFTMKDNKELEKQFNEVNAKK